MSFEKSASRVPAGATLLGGDLTIGSSFDTAPAGRITCFPTGQNFVVSSRHCWLSVARMTMTTTERDDEKVAKLAYPCARSMWQNAESFQEARQNRHDHHRPRRDQPPRDAR